MKFPPLIEYGGSHGCVANTRSVISVSHGRMQGVLQHQTHASQTGAPIDRGVRTKTRPSFSAVCRPISMCAVCNVCTGCTDILGTACHKCASGEVACRAHRAHVLNMRRSSYEAAQPGPTARREPVEPISMCEVCNVCTVCAPERPPRRCASGEIVEVCRELLQVPLRRSRHRLSRTPCTP
jgi:hypothetical protein